jgi:TRAP-type mannitol/chloroaromatic compound transport system permease large subunit
MMAVLIILGLFMDWVGILLLTMPIFVPIIQSLGYDPIWFGILFCMNMQISYLSPPFGPAAFYLKGVAPPEISLQDIYRALWPFMLMQMVAIGLVMAFPEIALWLPRVLMGGG